MKWILLIIPIIVVVMMIITNPIIYGAEKSGIEYVGTGDWLTEVDKCVDLYNETEQNETLYYGCMNKIEGNNE
jgi:hypothetical protein